MKGNRYILLLEDDAVETMRVERVMQSLDPKLRLEIAINGREGLNKLEQNISDLPSIILLDLNMPVMNGIEFLTAVKSDDRLKYIPVIILTTSASDNDKLATYNLGIAGYMVKPVRYSDFTEVMRTIYQYWEASELVH
jgi:CheY-like chemotaxis protein